MNASSLHQFGWYLRNVLLSEAGPDLLKPALRALVLERALGTPANKQEERDGSDAASGAAIRPTSGSDGYARCCAA